MRTSYALGVTTLSGELKSSRERFSLGRVPMKQPLIVLEGDLALNVAHKPSAFSEEIRAQYEHMFTYLCHA